MRVESCCDTSTVALERQAKRRIQKHVAALGRVPFFLFCKTVTWSEVPTTCFMTSDKRVLPPYDVCMYAHLQVKVVMGVCLWIHSSRIFGGCLSMVLSYASFVTPGRGWRPPVDMYRPINPWYLELQYVNKCCFYFLSTEHRIANAKTLLYNYHNLVTGESVSLQE